MQVIIVNHGRTTSFLVFWGVSYASYEANYQLWSNKKIILGLLESVGKCTSALASSSDSLSQLLKKVMLGPAQLAAVTSKQALGYAMAIILFRIVILYLIWQSQN